MAVQQTFKPAPLSSQHKQRSPSYHHPVLSLNPSSCRTATNLFRERPTDSIDTLASAIHTDKCGNPRHNLSSSQVIPVDLDELHFPSPDQLPGKRAYLNFLTVLPQDIIAYGTAKQAITASVMLGQVNSPSASSSTPGLLPESRETLSLKQLTAAGSTLQSPTPSTTLLHIT